MKINLGIAPKHQQQQKHIQLVERAFLLAPSQHRWVGIYYLDSYLNKGSTCDDLLLGPFIGAETEHQRISLQKGICGLAIREAKTIVVDDVKNHPQYLACSLETQSEIVIPIYAAASKKIVAELDIDAHQLNAFDEQIKKKIESLVAHYSIFF